METTEQQRMWWEESEEECGWSFAHTLLALVSLVYVAGVLYLCVNRGPDYDWFVEQAKIINEKQGEIKNCQYYLEKELEISKRIPYYKSYWRENVQTHLREYEEEMDELTTGYNKKSERFDWTPFLEEADLPPRSFYFTRTILQVYLPSADPDHEIPPYYKPGDLLIGG